MALILIWLVCFDCKVVAVLSLVPLARMLSEDSKFYEASATVTGPCGGRRQSLRRPREAEMHLESGPSLHWDSEMISLDKG